jgi:CysZ protein
MPHALGSRATFGTGLFSVFRAFGQLARLTKAWPYALVPALVFALLASAGVWASFAWLEPVVRGWLPAATSWYGRWGGSLLSHLGALLVAFGAVLLSLALAPSLSAPALERIVALVETDLGVPPRRHLGWLAEVACGFRALAAGAMFAVPVGALLWIADLLFPAAAVVTAPLKILVTALMVAWNLIDYPLTLRGMRVRERLALVRLEWRSFVGFGLGFAAAFWIPCCGIVLLPVGVVAATQVTSIWLGLVLSTSPAGSAGSPSRLPAR